MLSSNWHDNAATYRSGDIRFLEGQNFVFWGSLGYRPQKGRRHIRDTYVPSYKISHWSVPPSQSTAKTVNDTPFHTPLRSVWRVKTEHRPNINITYRYLFRITMSIIIVHRSSVNSTMVLKPYWKHKKRQSLRSFWISCRFSTLYSLWQWNKKIRKQKYDRV